MALHLYQSNRLSCLLELLLGVVSVPQADPFAAETILVQSKGMGRWLGFRLAQRQGVCANMRFPLPASFLWQLLQTVLGELPRQSVFSTDVLTWRIFAWLGQTERVAAFPRLAQYLHVNDEVKRYELAFRIADIFDQYLVYRPQWVEAWVRGKTIGVQAALDEDWQQALWQDLARNQPDFHRAQLLDLLIENLPKAAREGRLPERVTLFAMTSLPPRYVEVFQALADYMDVCFFALNPCQESWGDIRDASEQARLARSCRSDLYLATGNPLLAALGKQGRVFFDQLAAVVQLHSLFDTDFSRPTSLLHTLQADVLHLRDRTDPNAATFIPPERLAADDRSLQIHVCHSPMREVEVLHDQLLALFANDPSLEAADVAVLTPDIEVYAPYVEAVFAAKARGTPVIPYAVADKGLRTEAPLLAAWLAVLSAAQERVTTEMLLAWLEVPAIARQVGIRDLHDLADCRTWLEAAQIRWGYDASDRVRFDLPATDEHTWVQGLQRLLLGFALPPQLAGDAVPLWQGIAPLNVVEGQAVARLAALAQWIYDLFAQFKHWQTPCPLVAPEGEDSWVSRLQKTLAWFSPQGAEELALLRAREILGQLGDTAQRAQWHMPVAFPTVLRWLKAALAQPSNSSGFLTGSVTFCTMIPMRSLPFRVVCVLGLNDGEFPRTQPPLGFDLIGRFPLAGDRSRRLDDRYLFLETLLSAQDVLYLSYIGRDSRDNSIRPPSVLVSDLMEVVCRSFWMADSELANPPQETSTTSRAQVLAHLVTEHPLQPFDPRYFQPQTAYLSFSTAWFAAATALTQVTTHPLSNNPWFVKALPTPEGSWRQVDLRDLQQFFANPSRFLLQRRVQLQLILPQEPIPADEPFSPAWAEKQAILANRQHYDVGDAYALSRAQGQLPHGVMGQAWYEAVTMPLAWLQPHYPADFLPPCSQRARLYDENWGEFELTATFSTLTSEGAWHLDALSCSDKQLFSIWISHVWLCYFAPSELSSPPHSVVLALVKQSNAKKIAKRITFKPLTPSDAETVLRTLLAAYWYGLQQPLPFFSRTSRCFAQRLADNKEPWVPTRECWWGNPNNPSLRAENQDEYHTLAWRGRDPLDEPLFVTYAQTLWQPALAAMEETLL